MKKLLRGQPITLSGATRGTILFLTGLGLTIREALVAGPDRPSLYVLFAGMMGFPFVLRAANGKNGAGSSDKIIQDNEKNGSGS